MNLAASRRLLQAARLVALAAAVLARTTALAQVPDQPGSLASAAEAAISKGLEFRRQGRDRDAMTEFQKAVGLQKTPRAVAQLGLAEQALGLWIPAESHLQEALAEASDSWIQRTRKTLEDSLLFVRGHLGSVEVWGTPAGAEVVLDGAVAGTLPMARPARVTDDEVTLEVRAKGYATITRTLRVPRGKYGVREQVDLRKQTSVASLSPVVPADTRTGGPAGAELTARADVASDDHAVRFYSKTWFWLVVGAAAIVATTGIVIATAKTEYPSAQSMGTFNNPAQ